jgi:hypothetical protein
MVFTGSVRPVPEDERRAGGAGSRNPSGAARPQERQSVQK